MAHFVELLMKLLNEKYLLANSTIYTLHHHSILPKNFMILALDKIVANVFH